MKCLGICSGDVGAGPTVGLPKTAVQTWATGITGTGAAQHRQQQPTSRRNCIIWIHSHHFLSPFFNCLASDICYNNTEMEHLHTKAPQPSTPQQPLLLSDIPSSYMAIRNSTTNTSVHVSLSPPQFDVSYLFPCLIPSSLVAFTKWNANRPA